MCRQSVTTVFCEWKIINIGSSTQVAYEGSPVQVKLLGIL